eukprot:270137-Hanusia_phi.AAC.1
MALPGWDRADRAPARPTVRDCAGPVFYTPGARGRVIVTQPAGTPRPRRRRPPRARHVTSQLDF